MARITVSEARAALPEILDRVTAGEEVTITRHGQPVAVVVRPDALRSRRAGAALAAADGVRALLADARQSPLADAELSADRAEELIEELRRHRDRR